jgi:hypothetical protein
MGPFDNWRQMTSGAHGVLAAVSLCQSISLYGFSTYPGSIEGNNDIRYNKIR